MLAFLRRRRAALLAATTFCDSSAQVCTPDCRRPRISTGSVPPLFLTSSADLWLQGERR
jgi:hypothetical protein